MTSKVAIYYKTNVGWSSVTDKGNIIEFVNNDMYSRVDHLAFFTS